MAVLAGIITGIRFGVKSELITAIEIKQQVQYLNFNESRGRKKREEREEREREYSLAVPDCAVIGTMIGTSTAIASKEI